MDCVSWLSRAANRRERLALVPADAPEQPGEAADARQYLRAEGVARNGADPLDEVLVVVEIHARPRIAGSGGRSGHEA